MFESSEYFTKQRLPQIKIYHYKDEFDIDLQIVIIWHLAFSREVLPFSFLNNNDNNII